MRTLKIVVWYLLTLVGGYLSALLITKRPLDDPSTHALSFLNGAVMSLVLKKRPPEHERRTETEKTVRETRGTEIAED